MRFVFAMDTLDRVNPLLDTTYGFIEAAEAKGHACFHCLIHEVSHLLPEGPAAPVRRVRCEPDGLRLEGEPETIALADVDAVFIRKDPPFDQAYLYATLLLEGLRGQTLVVNDPRGLRDANEKLYTLHFARWMPKTIVTADRAAIFRFVEAVGGKAVIKPLDGAGGYGVLGVKTGDANAKAIVDLLTLEGRRLAMVQAFLPEVTEGDKRVLMLNGKLLGAILRVPPEGDHRANIHVGGTTEPTELTERETTIVEDIGPRLAADGLYFVGLDFIGEHLTEVNVTSPTGIRELSRFRGSSQSAKVIEWVEGAAAQPR